MPETDRNSDGLDDWTELSPDALQTVLPFFAETATALPVAAPELTIEDVRRYLVERIQTLLAHNPALLLSILYRIDVAEVSVKRVFEQESAADIPSHLADLIVERQLQKVRIRRRYSRRSAGREDSAGRVPDE